MTIKDISFQILIGVFVGFLIQTIKNLSLQGKIPINFYKEKWAIGFLVILIVSFLTAIINEKYVQNIAAGTVILLFYFYSKKNK